MSWFELWLILHIVAAIVAFGPTFVFPVVGPMIQANPQHAGFGFEVFHAMETKLIIPFALTMPVSGIGLISTAHVDTKNSTWLVVAIIAYIVAMVLAIFHQLPVTSRILGLLKETQPGSAPPAQTMTLIMRTRVVGILLTVLLLLIILMMIWRPGAAFS
jgi:hypothetical protein